MITKPDWIRTKWADSGKLAEVLSVLKKYNINTVCRSARCPNVCECFTKKHFTFMILGDVCTRNCKFCSVNKGMPAVPYRDEISNIIKAVEEMDINYAVITSVTRDDLDDGGAGVFAELICKLKEKRPYIKVEILTPDFAGEVYQNIIDSNPYIWAHNVETVPRLYSRIRPMADYKSSLNLLKNIKSKTDDIFTKSGIMLGLGESREEILEVFSDLRSAKVDIVYIGQYLKPSKESIDVFRYLTPEEFLWYGNKAAEMGFKSVKSAPLVRSSYR